jgi:hypothetical protein
MLEMMTDTSDLTVPGVEYKNNTATNSFSNGSSGNPNNVMIRNGNGQLVSCNTIFVLVNRINVRIGSK